MAKTLRFRTRSGWVTKPLERTPENRLLAGEVDDNFLALEDQTSQVSETLLKQKVPVLARSDVADYVLALTDAGAWVRVDRPTASTVTVPSDASVNFDIGTRIWVRRVGAGALALAAASGVTINRRNTLTFVSQHATVQLTKVGENVWDAFGELT